MPRRCTITTYRGIQWQTGFTDSHGTGVASAGGGRPVLRTRRCSPRSAAVTSARIRTPTSSRLLVSAANGGDALPAVYAVVAETIHRRLGLWRAFGDGAAPAAIRECRDVAAEVLDAAPYRARVEYYADEDFVDGPLFAASLEAALDRLRLSPERRAAVSATVYVAEKSRTTPRSQIMLPAEFYGAVQSARRRRGAGV